MAEFLGNPLTQWVAFVFVCGVMYGKLNMVCDRLKRIESRIDVHINGSVAK